MGDEYGIGLSLNTRGIIYERLANPDDGDPRQRAGAGLFFERSETSAASILAQINLGRAYRRIARGTERGQENIDFEKGEQYLKGAIGLQGPNTDRFYRIEALNELGCLYRDWVATLYEKEERDDRIAAFLDSAEENLRRAVELTSDRGDRGMIHIVQHVDSLEDLARVHYWRARFEAPGPEGNPLVVMSHLLEQAEALAKAHLAERAELKLILGKVLFQRARLAQLKKQSVEQIAGYYGLATGYAESHSLDAPEAHKFAADACDWLGELGADEVKQAVGAMYDALKDANLYSMRLCDSVDHVVKPLLGVGWPATEQETFHG